MKKILPLLFFFFAFTLSSKSQQLFVDDFTYSGTLTSNLWTAHSGAGTNPLTTTTQNLTYAGYSWAQPGNNAVLIGNAGGEDVNKTFASQSTNGQDIFVSFLVNVTDAATSKTGDYFLNIGSPGGATWTAFAGRVFARIVGGSVNFGLSNTSTATWGTTNFAKNTTYLIVVKYTINTAGTDPVSMWVFSSGVPVTEATAGTPEVSLTTTSGTDAINAIGLRQGSSSTQPQVIVDGIVVGTSWTSFAGYANPTTTSISPSSATAGDPGFTLTVNGTNFYSGASFVYWNSTLRPTTYVSPTQLTATISAADIATAGTASIIVQTNGAALFSNAQTFTINPGTTLSATSLASFGNVCTNTSSVNSFTLTGSGLNSSNVIVGPLAGFGFSNSSSGPFTATLSITPASGAINQTVYVQFTPTAVQSYNGNIPVSGGGASSISVAANGSGVNTPATVTTGTASNITQSSADVSGTFNVAGCGTVTYGFEYSTTSGFTNGTVVTSTNLNAGAFSATISGLTASTTYYYKAFATNNAGTSYGSEMSFTTTATPPMSTPVATVATGITTTSFTANWNAVTGATGYRLDVYTAPGVYVTGYQNLAVGNVTSYNVTGLSPATTYYYVVRAEGAGPVSANSNQITVTTNASPTLTATSLASFGTNCINTPVTNNFTINGANLTNANISVGPLAGYAFSTTSAPGSFTSNLSLPQPGGTYSQIIYVQFTPTAVQSYNGNIPVSGGGVTTAINVTATGSGVNTAPTVTTGAASSITFSSATLAGSISNNGCSPVTATGFEYSTTSGFANGTGTQVAATLSGTSFSASLSGLAPSTIYYYKAYATNAGGTSYGAQQSFTTLAPPPAVITVSPLAAFANTCVNTTAPAGSFTISGSNLTNANIVVGPLTGFTFSTSAAGTYTFSLTLTQPGGTYNQTVYVKFTPTAAQSYNGNIPVTGGGTTATTNVAATAAGTNTQAAPVTGNVTNLTPNNATISGNISSNGCSNPMAYGIEYSGNPNFAGGQGTRAYANLAGADFSVNLAGLVPGATYYYKAFVTNSGGTAYGSTQSFTVPVLNNTFTVYPSPVAQGREFYFSMSNLKPGYYAVVFYNVAGQRVYQKDFNVQGNYLNEHFTIPYKLLKGIYQVQLVNNDSVLGNKKVSVL